MFRDPPFHLACPGERKRPTGPERGARAVQHGRKRRAEGGVERHPGRGTSPALKGKRSLFLKSK